MIATVLDREPASLDELIQDAEAAWCALKDRREGEEKIGQAQWHLQRLWASLREVEMNRRSHLGIVLDGKPQAARPPSIPLTDRGLATHYLSLYARCRRDWRDYPPGTATTRGGQLARALAALPGRRLDFAAGSFFAGVAAWLDDLGLPRVRLPDDATRDRVVNYVKE